MEHRPVAAVTDIVDGHDSRTEAVSLEDELVKDADKRWRFTESAVRICHAWMELAPERYMGWVGSEMQQTCSSTTPPSMRGWSAGCLIRARSPNASKSALIGLSRVMARELGDDGVRVKALAPGFTLTRGQP